MDSSMNPDVARGRTPHQCAISQILAHCSSALCSAASLLPGGQCVGHVALWAGMPRKLVYRAPLDARTWGYLTPGRAPSFRNALGPKTETLNR